MRQPKKAPALWGIWLPEGLDGDGCWMNHVQAGDGPEAYESEAEAVKAAEYYGDDTTGDFPGCYAAPLCGTAEMTTKEKP